MIDIKAGRELDIAVADATGMVYAGYCRGGPMFCLAGEEDDLKSHIEVGVEWAPSTDLNAAFAAAEKIGLFSHKLPENAAFGNLSDIFQGDYGAILYKLTDDRWRSVDLVEKRTLKPRHQPLQSVPRSCRLRDTTS